ncbi:MAG TPA: SDR family NAD(P)-dependent oxidoreductase [Solirubrobacteraceae bacterium]|nr:SDR family NAD(P)-dependent oxidoreductase [Solirubrobacteraceae bacterium]
MAMTSGPGQFDGRVALVTGASGGIGGALCRRLAAAGASVAVHYRSSAESAERLVEEIRAEGGRGATFEAELGQADRAEALITEVEERLGPIDLLVANAGLSRPGPLEEVDADTFDQALAVNLRAPFLQSRRVIPHMREQGWGRILFTSSVAAFTGGLVGPHYAASKAGLHGLLHFLAARVAGEGVTVNAIAPALIEDTTMLPGDPGDLASRIPVGRLGKPDEVADLAMAILRNGYMTSQVVEIDGGMYPR